MGANNNMRLYIHTKISKNLIKMLSLHNKKIENVPVPTYSNRPGFRRPCGSPYHRPWRHPDSHLHACGYGRVGQGSLSQGLKGGYQSPDHPGQYVSPVPPSGPGHPVQGRRPAQIRALGRPHPHGQRRFPGVLPLSHPQTHGRGLQVLLPHRRQQAHLYAGKQRGYPAHHRGRYHHGPGRMLSRRRRHALCRQVAQAHAGLAGALRPAF